MYRELNLNPEKKRVGDCTVRAIAAATHQEWAAVYAALVLAGFELHDMPSANYVWGSYARRGSHYVRGHYSRDDARDSMMRKLEDMIRNVDGYDRETIQHCIDELKNI